MQKIIKQFSTIGKPVYIVASKRTPIASFLSGYMGLSAPEIASIAIKGTLQQINI